MFIEIESSKRKRLEKTLLISAAALLLVSLLFPYWRVKVFAPQYPKGLIVQIRPYRIEGDVREIDGLNHYIGMRRLETAAEKERQIALPAIAVAVICLLLSAFIPQKRAIWLTLPALLFPLIFIGDIYWWLRESGLNLDPKAPLNRAVKPFIPPLLGEGKIAQFRAVATFQLGFYIAGVAMLLTLTGLYLKRLNFLFPGVPAIPRPFAGILSTGLMLLLVSPALAETRTVVSAENLADALKSATAGETVVVRGGLYDGRIVVDKSVQLIGEDSPIIDGGGKGTVVQLLAPNIVFRGFVVRNSGDLLSAEDSGVLVKAANVTVADNRIEEVLFGVHLRQAPNGVISHNTLRGKDLPVPRRGDLIRVWYSNHVQIENNQLIGGRDLVLWFSKHLTVRQNEARRGRYGLHFMYCDDATIEGNRLVDNSVGAYLMYSYRLRLKQNWMMRNRGPSGYGLGQKDMYDGVIADNFFADNRIGIFVENSTGVFRGNLISFNDFGLSILPSARHNEFARNSFVDNGEQVVIEGQGAVGSNRWTGNYWSDYTGYDVDGDTVGDVPYRSVHLFERLTERHPALRLFTHSPSAQALDFAARLVPLFAPQPKLTDEAPLMRPVIPPLDAPKRRVSSAWLLSSAALFLSALTLLGRLGRRKPVGQSTPDASGAPQMLPLDCQIRRRRLGFGNPNRARRGRLNINRKDGNMEDTQTAISVNHLTKRFGQTVAVDDVSFDVEAGETVALWGANGAGKTTALRCLLGILPFDGEITVCGENARTAGKSVRMQIGYVPQEVRLHSELSVRETIGFYARLRGVSTERVETLMAEWHLSEIAEKPIGELSGGMKQRLALAIALLSDPPILLLDEPTSNLDITKRHEFWAALERLKKAGKTLIFCSHRIDEIFRLADRVIVMDNGKKVAEGSPASLNGYLPRETLLHLTVPQPFHTQAAELLAQHGISAQPNGTKIAVQTPHDRKAEPFRILMDGAIPIDDFELERSDP